MYIPAGFRVDEPAAIHEFIERFGFATLVTLHNGSPFATHIPLLLDRGGNRLLGHMARANPHWRSFADERESLAVFQGPHAYISPSWYVSEPNVPTWNYTAVHVYGRPRVVDERSTAEIVRATVEKYESHREAPWPYAIPDEYRDTLLKAIVGFEMPIVRVEAKFKLGQNRSDADRGGMLERLHTGNSAERGLAEFIDERGTISGDRRR